MNQDGKKKKKSCVVQPGYLDWQGLEIYSSCSKRWLQDHVPRSLWFRKEGKQLIRVEEFDSWIEQYRQPEDQGLDRVLNEVMGGLESA